MKRPAAKIFPSLLFVALAAAGHAKVTWSTDFAAAQVKAAHEHKRLFLDFTGSDWCGYCMRLDDEVLTTDDFETFSKSYILVRLDYPREKKLPEAEKIQNETLRERYSVHSFPTAIVTDAHGNELVRAGGFAPGTPAADYLEQFTSAAGSTK